MKRYLLAGLLAAALTGNALGSGAGTPVAAARSFYTWYISPHGGGSTYDAALKRRLTPHLYSLLAAADEEAEVCGCVILDGPPFLDVQMGAPVAFSTASASVAGTTAVVPVTVTFAKDAKHPSVETFTETLKLQVQKAGSVWLISDVGDSRGFGLVKDLEWNLADLKKPAISPERAIWGFYNWHSSVTRQKLPFWFNFAFTRHLLAPALYAQLQKVYELHQSGHALDYDPFSGVSAPPSGYRQADAVISGGTATAIVTIDHKNVPPSQVKVVIEKVPGGWQISDFIGKEGSLYNTLRSKLGN